MLIVQLARRAHKSFRCATMLTVIAKRPFSEQAVTIEKGSNLAWCYWVRCMLH